MVSSDNSLFFVGQRPIFRQAMPLFQACAPMTRPGSVARIVGVAKDLSIVRISWLCLCQKSTNKIGDRFHHSHPLNQPPLFLQALFLLCFKLIDPQLNLKHLTALGFPTTPVDVRGSSLGCWETTEVAGATTVAPQFLRGAPRLARFARFYGHRPFFHLALQLFFGGVLRSHFFEISHGDLNPGWNGMFCLEYLT